MPKPKIIFLVGPTAVGKSETAVYLAKKVNAQIISCDSMQIYKDMDIITSKASLALRRKIPHHLLSIVSPSQEYNVSRYRQEAIKRIKKIIKSGKVTLFVGGTGLYASILIDGIFKSRSEDKNVRNLLYKQAERYGNQYLYARLKRVDAQAASKIHPNDTKRIIRALEVFETTGKPISELQKERKGLKQEYAIKIFCLNMQRDKLYKRIDARVDRMFKQGLEREVKKLLKQKLSRTASYAIGIRELKGFFCGLYDLEEAKRLIKRNSRQYAKRQLTWFRKDKRIRWLEVSDKEKPVVIANRIFNHL